MRFGEQRLRDLPLEQHGLVAAHHGHVEGAPFDAGRVPHARLHRLDAVDGSHVGMRIATAEDLAVHDDVRGVAVRFELDGDDGSTAAQLPAACGVRRANRRRRAATVEHQRLTTHGVSGGTLPLALQYFRS